MKPIPTIFLLVGVSLSLLAPPDGTGVAMAWIGGMVIGFTIGSR
jgi:hypothetical protein